MIILTGCAANELRHDDEVSRELDTKATPFVVGTWRWSGSGGRIGDIELGEEQFVFRNDGTYTVLSTSGDGRTECYEGTFTWAAGDDSSHGTIVFKRSAFAGEVFEREVRLEGGDTLDFGVGGMYRRTSALADLRCP